MAESCLFAALVSPSRVFTRCYNLPPVASVTFERFHSVSEGWANSQMIPGILLHHHKLLCWFATSPGIPCLVPHSLVNAAPEEHNSLMLQSLKLAF